MLVSCEQSTLKKTIKTKTHIIFKNSQVKGICLFTENIIISFYLLYPFKKNVAVHSFYEAFELVIDKQMKYFHVVSVKFIG